ncbi:MAG: hypothetical protein RI906_1754 [Pseudomonadota bacterium]|jgi:hypothetical protein
MSALSIQPPFPIFTDTDGSPLENGYVWLGTANQDPQANPIAAYWDAALTITAPQPIRTSGGYPARSGAPARLYVNSDYSIRVQNKNGSQVYSAPEATEAYGGGIINASVVVYDPAGLGAVTTTVQAKLRETVSVKDFGAVGDGLTDDTAEIQLAVTYGLANNVAVYWPTGTYICGALTASSGGDLIWFGENSAEIKRTGTDITLISPTGNVRCTGLKFTDYMIGFNFTGIAAAKTVVFDSCTIQNCGTTATAGGRVDFQGFVTNKNATSNKIAKLEVVNSAFTGDDFGIVWQGKLDSALITGCSFSTMRRMAVLIGLQASGRTSKDCENIVITGNTFQDIISNDASEVEIHAVLIYGYRVVVSNNTVDKCADIHASTHDSEAIYLKAVLATVEGNIVQDGGRGDGTITIKGDPFTAEPEDVPDANRAKYVIVSGNVVTTSDDFVATYNRPFAGIYSEGSRVDIKNNSISGKYDRGIASGASGHITGNIISAEISYGILYAPLDATDQTFIKITDNFVEALGVTSAGISARLATTTAMALPVTQIDNNLVRLGSAATTTGEETGISVRADRVASGNNTFNFVQVSNNSVQGRSGINFNGINLTTNIGTGNNGIITTAHLIGNSARLPLYGVSISGSAGDIVYMHVADSTFNGTGAAFNNPNLPTTAKIRNIRGNRVLTSSGTATITAANTEVTVTMGINDPDMRPTTLDLISVRPTNNIGTATKWWIDTLSGDTFKIKVDAAPGASTATFAWEAKNQYYY